MGEFWFWWRLTRLTSIVHIDHSAYRSCRNCEDDPEDTTEGCSDEHHDKYEKWWEIEGSTHDIGDQYVILCLLYDDIEYEDRDCLLPPESESDDESGDESNDRSEIWDELHHSTDECQSKCLARIKSQCELYERQSNIGQKEDTERENEHGSYPGIECLLYLTKMLD